MTKVTVTGMDKLERQLEAITPAIRNEMKGAISDSLLRVHRAAVKRVQKGPATGKIYNRRGKPHQASAPYEAPMSDTGTLARSGHVVQDSDGLGGEVVFDAKYARYLELGTRNMVERPYLLPSLRDNEDYIDKRTKQAVRDGTKTGGRK